MDGRLRRYFITQHPTFGSYSNPTKKTIEQSPYYYWWLALTLSEEYIALCESVSANKVKLTNSQIHQTYRDFGDVRYEGSKYLAFTKWWISKVSEKETRGEFLFAEPVSATSVMLIDDIEVAKEAAKDNSTLLLNIPKNFTRKRIDKALENIFKRELEFERGRQTKNPNRSNARYALTKAVKVENLKQSFDIVEVERHAKLKGEKLDNLTLADAVGLKVELSETTKSEQDELAAYEVYMLQTKVSKKKKIAKTAIRNIIKGIFP